eukprot:CAMPEP_0168530338 /NCGR_PEP_ID=MMETSP0405-20121227/14596_1 /TAXON_ID=498012 /ORGANISM="Trichosphaerium sp, Strain Am-I-7 wt" /LENGTH=205 /DNA_ID=CAMNT_0008554537 /DNA_START=49 /DNA_END=662 /DNA_ORIENTATION=-
MTTRSTKDVNVIVITDPETRQDVEISEKAYNLVLSLERKRIKQLNQVQNTTRDTNITTLSNLLRSWKHQASVYELNEKHLKTMLKDKDEQITAQRKTIRKLKNTLVMVNVDLEEQNKSARRRYQQHSPSNNPTIHYNSNKRKMPPTQVPQILVGHPILKQRKRPRVSRTITRCMNSPLYLPGKGAKPSPAKANAPRYSIEPFHDT